MKLSMGRQLGEKVDNSPRLFGQVGLDCKGDKD
jgi:hypothetical protein